MPAFRQGETTRLQGIGTWLVWRVKFSLWILILTMLASAWAQEAPLEAGDIAALKSAMGRTVVVHGVVEKISVTSSGHRKVHFKDSSLFLYLNSSDFEKRSDWKLEEWIGKEVYAGGPVKSYFGKPEIILTDPAQIATAANQVKLPAGSSSKNAPALGTGFAVNATTASLTQLRLDVRTTTKARFVALVSESMELRWEKAASTSSSGSVLRFETSGTTSKGRDPADRAVSFVTARHGGQWPAGRFVRMTRQQQGDKAGWPSMFTTSLLLESTVIGLPLPPRLLVTGELTANGTLERGENEVFHILKNGLQATLLVPESAAPALQDFFLENGPEALAVGPIFAVKSLDDAIHVLQVLSNKNLDAPLAVLASWREPLKARGLGVLRQSEDAAKLEAMARLCPQLLNAQMMQTALKLKPDTTLSQNGTANRLFAFHAECAFNLAALQSDEPEKRKVQADYAARLAKLQPLCHPKYKSFAKALDTLLDALKDARRNEPKDTSDRAKKARAALADAISKASSEAAGVEGEIGLGH